MYYNSNLAGYDFSLILCLSLLKKQKQKKKNKRPLVLMSLKDFPLIRFGASASRTVSHAVETLPIGYMRCFDFALNSYEKLFRYSHFQCDFCAVGLCSCSA